MFKRSRENSPRGEKNVELGVETVLTDGQPRTAYEIATDLSPDNPLAHGTLHRTLRGLVQRECIEIAHIDTDVDGPPKKYYGLVTPPDALPGDAFVPSPSMPPYDHDSAYAEVPVQNT